MLQISELSESHLISKMTCLHRQILLGTLCRMITRQRPRYWLRCLCAESAQRFLSRSDLPRTIMPKHRRLVMRDVPATIFQDTQMRVLVIRKWRRLAYHKLKLRLGY